MSKLNARMQQLHKTAEQWATSSFIPEKGELIIYDPDLENTNPRVKIGDGIHIVSELPFIVADQLEGLISWIGDIGYIDSGEI